MLSQQNSQTIAIRPDRRSACPGLSRMVMSKDGAIARIKLRLGRLSVAQAQAIADIAERFETGAIELSIRSNIQLRGIHPDVWPDVIEALHDAGLGAQNKAADDVRNVMVSPTAGIDHGQISDVTALAGNLLSVLQDNETYHALSPKFSLQIDGGEDCAMISHPGDIWLSAIDGGKAYAFGLASSPDKQALGAVSSEHALPFIEALLQHFLGASQKGIARMKHLFEVMPVADFLQTLPFAFDAPASWQRKAPIAHAHLGLNHQLDGNFYVGAMPLLGRLTPQQLRELAGLAKSELRLTPWQGILIPHIAETDSKSIISALHTLGLSTELASPATRLRACSGSKGCASALADTQADSEKLALKLKSDTKQIHITGCTKSCAALSPLPHTLLARSPMHYDLFLQDKAGPSRFGRLLASNITIDEAAKLLNK
ncbi:precorrin-3B synthase [Brucella pseudogrignonensis]|uniref:Precorrin-3B synthase n=1 Tax=Brucella pseudogrignonensis TaxID=419475 RepID=A0ABU1M4L9_9HYPH|nr:precorrin-3B synthase [Brucella pseudogrignonensis]MDR6430696.1 precorrin-3B synthase [Brucella pseudogrignonensis]